MLIHLLGMPLDSTASTNSSATTSASTSPFEISCAARCTKCWRRCATPRPTAAKSPPWRNETHKTKREELRDAQKWKNFKIAQVRDQYFSREPRDFFCDESMWNTRWSHSKGYPRLITILLTAPILSPNCGLRGRVWQRTPCNLLGKSVWSDNDQLNVKTHDEPQAAHALIVVMLACFLLRSSTGLLSFPSRQPGHWVENSCMPCSTALVILAEAGSGLGIQTLPTLWLWRPGDAPKMVRTPSPETENRT